MIEADALDREIGARLRHVRKVRGLSQTELGAAIGVSFQQIQKYEHGANRLSTSALILLARALDVSPSSLLGDNGPTAPDVDWTLLSSDGAHELLQALSQIRSPETRKIVLELARDLAKVEADG
jgi:transcriptional regulator with XRE-family HTH domain